LAKFERQGRKGYKNVKERERGERERRKVTEREKETKRE